MKKLIALGMALSFSAAMAANTNYAPNDGTASPGNPGTQLNQAGNEVTNMDPTILDTDDPTIEGQENGSLERSNTTPNPIPSDTTLEGRTPKKQSQESTEDKVDYRTSPGVNHDTPATTEPKKP
ncbi:MAG: hypothetical protein ACJ76H_12615 [Bacteriovoracaceae bacterium]